MTWFTALLTGAGAGLAYFGGLWLTVRAAPLGARSPAFFLLSYLARFALAMLVLFALAQDGPSMLLAGLAGLLLARWSLLGRTGRLGHEL
jgi:F1F0 ATPase subunit 2